MVGLRCAERRLDGRVERGRDSRVRWFGDWWVDREVVVDCGCGWLLSSVLVVRDVGDWISLIKEKTSASK